MSQEVVDCVERSVRAPLALTSTTRPWRAASQGLHSGVRGPVHTGSEVLHLHTSGIARGWTLRSIYYWLCVWLVVTLSVSGFVIFHSIPLISVLHLSVFHPLELTQNDRQSRGRTDTPSARIPHPATLRSVKVSAHGCHPHEALSHMKLVSSTQLSSRGMEMIVDH